MTRFSHSLRLHGDFPISVALCIFCCGHFSFFHFGEHLYFNLQVQIHVPYDMRKCKLEFDPFSSFVSNLLNISTSKTCNVCQLVASKTLAFVIYKHDKSFGLFYFRRIEAFCWKKVNPRNVLYDVRQVESRLGNNIMQIVEFMEILYRKAVFPLLDIFSTSL